MAKVITQETVNAAVEKAVAKAVKAEQKRCATAIKEVEVSDQSAKAIKAECVAAIKA